MANSLTLIVQLIIALGLLNVWLLRFNKSTNYRGGDAQNLKEEFAEYGLPESFCYFVGFLKVSSAIALIAGIWIPSLTLPAAFLIAVLMFGAVAMHLKVKDPIKKTLPALGMLAMSLLVSAAHI